jgi:hypothetical protein
MECPFCYTRYDKIWKVFNHLELGSNKCRIQHMDKYLQYVDQYSGGLLIAKEDYRKDCSKPIKYVKYEVSEAVSLKLYNPAKVITIGPSLGDEGIFIRR